MYLVIWEVNECTWSSEGLMNVLSHLEELMNVLGHLGN